MFVGINSKLYANIKMFNIEIQLAQVEYMSS